jgi:hypothetical protein
MLALAPGVVYLHEPFNMDYAHPGKCTARFPYRFTYVTDENETAYARALARTIALRFNVWAEMRATSQVWRPLWDALGYARLRWQGARTLVKDPLAVFSTVWLARRFDMAVVVLVRHPAAFAGSIKRFDWVAPFDELLAQPLWRRDWLGEMGEAVGSAHSWPIVDQAALLWRLVYAGVRRWQSEHPDWIFIRHEDLSRAPVTGFETLYQQLGLSFSRQIAEEIEAHSSTDNPAAAPAGESAPGLRLNSRANIWNWRHRLDAEEVRRVRELTQPVASAWYKDDDWRPPATAAEGGGS